MIVPPPEVSSPKYNPKNNVNERVKYNNLFNKFISFKPFEKKLFIKLSIKENSKLSVISIEI